MLRTVPRISCSLLAARDRNIDLPSVVRDMHQLGVDMIHYDVSDEADALDLRDLHHYKELTPLPFDIHLSVRNPADYVDQLHLSQSDFFSLHVENAWSLSELRELKRQLGCRFGLALNRETDVEALIEPASLIDFSLFMAATPGVSGGSFDDTVVDKIKTFRRLAPSVPIHVDGGVNGTTAAVLRELGVDVMISGSYIFKAQDGIRQVTRLLGRNLHLRVSEIMRPLTESPGVGPDSSIRRVASEIEAKRVGCTCVVDGNKRLVGLITDGDLRRRLMTGADLSGVAASELMTRAPFTTSSNTRLLDLLRGMEEGGTSYAVVPVVDADDEFRGLFYLRDILFNGASA